MVAAWVASSPAWAQESGGGPAASEVVEDDESGPRVTRVEVRGNIRVSEADVLATVHTAAGEPYSRARVRRDVLALYDLEFFDDVVVERIDEPDGVAIVFNVVERPMVHEVVIEGNDAVDDEDIEEVIDIRENTILRIPQVERIVERITEVYAEEGYFLAEVSYELRQTSGGAGGDDDEDDEDDERASKRQGKTPRAHREREAGNEVDVVFRIVENDRVRIRNITFVGNSVLDDDELRDAIQTNEWGPFSFLSKSGTFRREALEQDMMMLQARYYDEGYLNVHVGTPRVSLTPDRRHLDISVPVEEGVRFKIGRVRVRETNDTDEEIELLGGRRQVREMIEIERGTWFARKNVAADLERIQRHYRDQGYANVNIEPRTAVDVDTRIVDLLFDIQRGPLVRIERINVRGNEKTRDRVIRREMSIAEGDLYSESKIGASKRRIEALGFFEKVEVNTRRGSSDELMEINIEVTERPTGTFQIGAGFSSQENFIATAQISQQNLFGRGQTLSLQGQISSLRQLFQLQFVEPYLFDSRWILTLNIFNMVRAYEDFNRTSTGGSLGFGYPILQDLRLYLTYTGEYVDVDTSSAGTIFGPSPSFRGVLRNLPLANLFNDGFTSSLRANVTYDTRNNRLFPTRGTYDSLAVEVATRYIGSQTQFVRWQGFTRWYFPLFWEFVLRINLDVGLIYNPEGLVPIYERFFEGGIYSVRGFGLRSLGPRITSVPSALDPDRTPITGGVNIGGNLSVVANVEIEFPLIPQVNIRGVIFFDAGNAFNLEQFWCDQSSAGSVNVYSDPCLGAQFWMLRTSVGFGFRWFSPLGPLRFEWGIPLYRYENEDNIDFQFTIGNVF
jgi:outer membrane protein insertion porin family